MGDQECQVALRLLQTRPAPSSRVLRGLPTATGVCAGHWPTEAFPSLSSWTPELWKEPGWMAEPLFTFPLFDSQSCGGHPVLGAQW